MGKKEEGGLLTSGGGWVGTRTCKGKVREAGRNQQKKKVKGPCPGNYAAVLWGGEWEQIVGKLAINEL